MGHDRDGMVRQWAGLDFVPREKTEKKDTEPLRYVGLRLGTAQGELFGDGNEHRYHAFLSNRWDMDGDDLIEWNRAKASTIEHVHDPMKNGLGAGQWPSAKLGANAAWVCIAFNIMSALRQAWPDESPNPSGCAWSSSALRGALCAVAARSPCASQRPNNGFAT